MNLMSPHFLSKKVGQSNKRLEKEVVEGRKSNLESFSEGKMGRGLLIWKKKLHLQIAEPFQSNLPHNEIAKTLNISFSAVTQYQKNQENRCVQRTRPKKPQYWTLMGFRPSGSTALNTGMILTWKPLL